MLNNVPYGICTLLSLLQNNIFLLQVDSFVKIFPKCAHGWTVRYDVSDTTAVSFANEAHQDMLEWFAKYVK